MSRSDLLQIPLMILGAAWHLILRQAREHPWTVAVALYGAARAFGIMIQSGHRGVLFRWGKAVGELEPGFHWLIPLVHGVRTTPVRSVTIHLPGQKVMTADGLVYDVSVSVVYRVEDATRALTLVDDVDAGCRAAIPIVVAEVLRARDQAQLVERASLDRELSDRMGAWIARWGLVVEQAGFTSIAPDKGALRTTQLRSRTTERARALRDLIDGGLDAESALVMLGSERQPVAKSSRPYHARARRPARAARARRAMQKPAAPPSPAKPADASPSAGPTATKTATPTPKRPKAPRRRKG
ncbi:FtsH protease regulator HflK [Aquisphaera giovannonii]|uniref:FtsH protease regulator HflK n=1 Tax=Aquisphaera giovannonii TaxID=406548 RepID=A0A5B9W4R2_9BACT|nr:SPFH domain-containing protein [Aquisphaera giovannonii]QEH35219.1 FtsH protease regulator HflK [Aquisphaera giovannonii]